MGVTYQRSTSPYLDLDKEKNINTYITTPNKIHRIRSRRGFSAEVLAVVSPSEIWIRPENHVTEDLTIPVTEVLPNASYLTKNCYVMAQYDDKVNARARVLYLMEGGAVIRFIDHGIVVFRAKHQLFQMEERLKYYAWQSILAALHDATPLDNNVWSTEEVQALRLAVSQYSMFYVIPKKSRIYWNNDDSIAMRIELNGLEQDQTEGENVAFLGPSEGASILEMYWENLPPRIDPCFIDGTDQSEYPCLEEPFGDLSVDPLGTTLNFLKE